MQRKSAVVSRRVIWSVVILSLLLVLTAFPAYAQARGGHDHFRFGENAVVRNGETVDGNLVVFGAQAIVEPGGRVLGDVVAIGGNVAVSGDVQGSIVAWGGNVEAAASAIIGKDAVAVGGNVHRAAGATVRGSVVEGLDVGRSLRGLGWASGPFQSSPNDQRPIVNGWLRDFLQRAFGTAGLILVSALVVLFLPVPTTRVARTMQGAPIASLGIGFLTLLAAAFLLPLLAIVSAILLVVCVGVFGFALLGILSLVLGAAALFGWIAAGLFLGEQIFTVLRVEDRLPVLAVILGVLIISSLGSVPCLGGIFSFVVACLGLGAVVLSRGGTQAYPGPILPPSPPVPVYLPAGRPEQ